MIQLESRITAMLNILGQCTAFHDQIIELDDDEQIEQRYYDLN